ncbi:hypothetical protein U9M48_007770 [Paspalum notatum var. saurae]|uniref:F-box domain-containing protein n=1 Tax=Paspalum notatum var. saurae TaxID=547442 RepID=A0AAQ3SN59_PASNO
MEPSASLVAAEAADPLAYFPAHLLDEILGRVDLCDAVRTSALSRAWRGRWESVPGLALSFPDGTPPSAIGGVLLLYTAPRVSGFACEVDEESAYHLDHWLTALSRRSVQSISIRAYLEGERFPLHSSIFSCAHLVSLHLELYVIPLIPVGFAGFPVLEELYLSHVEFQDSDVMEMEAPFQAIIRRSPLLCVLALDGLYHSSWDNFGYDLGGFLAGLYQFRELTFLAPDGYVDIGTLPTFYNLKSLELTTCFIDINPILVMFSLMRSSPNLEKFKMQIQKPEIVADWDFLNAQWTDDMCANLQIVEIISDPIRQWLPISFMKLVLSKASLLRTLSVDVCLGSQDDPLNELLTCRRASAQAQVLFEASLASMVTPRGVLTFCHAEVQLERFWNL